LPTHEQPVFELHEQPVSETQEQPVSESQEQPVSYTQGQLPWNAIAGAGEPNRKRLTATKRIKHPSF